MRGAGYIRGTAFTGARYRTGEIAGETGLGRRAARALLLAFAAEGSLYEYRPGYFRVTPYGPLAEGRSAL